MDKENEYNLYNEHSSTSGEKQIFPDTSKACFFIDRIHNLQFVFHLGEENPLTRNLCESYSRLTISLPENPFPPSLSNLDSHCQLTMQETVPHLRGRGLVRKLQTQTFTYLKNSGYRYVDAYVPFAYRISKRLNSCTYNVIPRNIPPEGKNGGFRSLVTLLTPVLEDGFMPRVRITKISQMDYSEFGSHLGVRINMDLLNHELHWRDREQFIQAIISGTDAQVQKRKLETGVFFIGEQLVDLQNEWYF